MNASTRFSMPGRIIGAAVLCAVAAGLFGLSVPGLAEKSDAPNPSSSEAIFQILPASDAPKDIPHETWFATEFENVACQETLLRVVSALNLGAQWKLENNPSAAAAKLRSIISVQRVSISDIVSLTVRAGNAQESAKIADACVQGYSERRAALYMADQEKQIAMLQDVINNMERKNEENRIAFLNVTRKYSSHKQPGNQATLESLQAAEVEEAMLKAESNRLVGLKAQDLEAALEALYPATPAPLRSKMHPEKLAQATMRLEALRQLVDKHHHELSQMTEVKMAEKNYQLTNEELLRLRKQLLELNAEMAKPFTATQPLQLAQSLLGN